jgi:plastocyanin
VPVLIGLAILALGVSIALGSRTANAAEAGPTPVTVHIRDDGLNPAAANAEPGGTVIWINDTNAVRSVVATDASFMSGPLEPGEQFQFAFTEPRYVNYEVPEQPGLAGTVVVGDATATSDPPVPVPTGPPAAAPEPGPTSGFAYTGASSAVNALIGGLVLAFGAGLIALGHHFGWTAALTSWTFANMTDDMLPSRRHRRVRKAQARRSFRPWERRRT